LSTVALARFASSGYMWEGPRNSERQMLLHDGDCGLCQLQARSSASPSRRRQAKYVVGSGSRRTKLGARPYRTRLRQM